MDLTKLQLTDNSAEHNYEMLVDGQRAFIDYALKGDKMYLLHTEVPEAIGGKGVAAAMVEKALQDIEARGLKLVPLCAYVQTFLKRHPEWNRLV